MDAGRWSCTKKYRFGVEHKFFHLLIGRPGTVHHIAGRVTVIIRVFVVRKRLTADGVRPCIIRRDLRGDGTCSGTTGIVNISVIIIIIWVVYYIIVVVIAEGAVANENATAVRRWG